MERRKGEPRSEEERRIRHEQLYPGTPLPQRGYRVGAASVGSKLGLVVVGTIAVIGLIALAASELKKA